MPYLAADENEKLHIYQNKPLRSTHGGFWWSVGHFIELSRGSIEKLIGKELTWADEPVEI
jgi:hypothetical protein